MTEQERKQRMSELRELAEKSWEGCHHCDENDKEFWINGFITGVLSTTDEWDEIEEEYAKDEYPVFGGPFTNALTPWEWLKKWYHSPKRKK